MDKKLGIADAINGLRSELTKAFWEGANEAVRFKVAELEVELEVAVTVEATAKAETKWWVLNLSGEGRVERAGTHKVRLKLLPELQGQPLNIHSDLMSAPEGGTNPKAAMPKKD